MGSREFSGGSASDRPVLFRSVYPAPSPHQAQDALSGCQNRTGV